MTSVTYIGIKYYSMHLQLVGATFLGFCFFTNLDFLLSLLLLPLLYKEISYITCFIFALVGIQEFEATCQAFRFYKMTWSAERSIVVETCITST